MIEATTLNSGFGVAITPDMVESRESKQLIRGDGPAWIDVSNPNGWQGVAQQPSIVGDRYLFSVPNPTENPFYSLRQ